MAKSHAREEPNDSPPASTRREIGKGAETATAKLFMHGRSQAVRLPKDFRFPGTEVRVSRVGNGVLLEPMPFDVQAWFARLDALGDTPFLPEGIDDPPPVAPETIFDE